MAELEIEGLTKRFGDRIAVNSLSLTVRSGEVLGFLGPNGAGKTTTIALVMGLVEPDGGRIDLGGRGDPRDPTVRRLLGLAPQSLALYEDLTGRENLFFFGRLYRMPRARLAERTEWALEFVGLSDRADDRVATYSGGMQRRLNLAAAILHQPEILFLDEPTVGVDPHSRNRLFQNIEALREEGCTIVYSTHYMEEAERLCDRVAVLDHGELLALESVDELVEKHGGQGSLTVTSSDGTEHEFATQDPAATLATWDSERQGSILGISMQQPNLEDVFLNLTGRTLRDS